MGPSLQADPPRPLASACASGVRLLVVLACAVGLGACRDGCPRLSPAGGLAAERRPDGRHFVASSDGQGTCPLPLFLPVDDGLSGAAERAVLATWPTQSDPAETGWSDIAEGRHPVVIFAHASVASSCRVHTRYRRMHEDWAARGWVVLSVAAGRSYCGSMDADNLEGRAGIVDAVWEGLDALDRGAGDLGPFSGGALDPARVVLAGHSRGGGAALLSGARAAASGHPPLGVVAFQPVDPAAWSIDLPPVAAPTLLVLAERDADVSALHTASLPDAFTDRWASVEIPGGIHAWTTDDIPPRKDATPQTTASEQRTLSDGVAALFLEELRDEAGPTPWDWAPEVQDLSPTALRMRWGPPPGAVLVDDFDDGDPTSGPLGTHASEGLTEDHEGVPFPESAPGRHGRARWRRVAGQGHLELALGAAPLPERVTVELHALLDPGTALRVDLGGDSAPLHIAAPGDDSLASPERAVLLRAALAVPDPDPRGSSVLRVHVDGGAWIDQVSLLP